MARFLQTDTFDAATELKDAGAVTANNTAGTVSAAARVVNLGSAFARMILNVDIDSIAVDGTDEAYEIILQGSTTSDFSSDVHNITVVHAGLAAVNGEPSDVGVGRIQRFVMNTVDGSTPLPYVRILTKTVGATVSIDFRAFLTKSPH